MDWKDSVRLAPSNIVKKQFISASTRNAKIVQFTLIILNIVLNMKKK